MNYSAERLLTLASIEGDDKFSLYQARIGGII